MLTKEDSWGIVGCLLHSVDSHALAIPPSAFFTFLYVFFESTSRYMYQSLLRPSQKLLWGSGESPGHRP